MKKIVKVFGNVKNADMVEDWKIVEAKERTFLETSVGKDKKFSLICNENVAENCKYEIDWDNLDLIPLYKNCIVNYKKSENKNFENKLVVKIVTEKPIASIKLDNAYLLTPIIQDKKIDEGINEIAFAAFTQTKDFFIRVYTEDGNLYKFSLESTVMEEVKHQVRKQATKLKAPTYLTLPKKVYVTDNIRTNRIKDYISIFYKDLISKNTTIDAAKTEEVLLDSRIADKIDEKTIKVFVPKAKIGRTKQFTKNRPNKRKNR